MLLSGLKSRAHQCQRQQMTHRVASACGNLREDRVLLKLTGTLEYARRRIALQHAPHNQSHVSRFSEAPQRSMAYATIPRNC